MDYRKKKIALKKYYDDASLMLDILGEMPTGIKVEEDEYMGMNVYLDKSTMVMQKFKNKDAFRKAKAETARRGQGSLLRNVSDNQNSINSGHM